MRILIVTGDPDQPDDCLTGFVLPLSDEGYGVRTVYSLEEAEKDFDLQSYDAVLSPLHPPTSPKPKASDIQTFTFLDRCVQRNPNLKCCICSNQRPNRDTLKNNGRIAVIPLNLEKVLEFLRW